MRDRVQLTDLTVLSICLSNRWGTLERRCLSDSVYFRNIGGNAFILCLKESILDKEARKQDIPRLYFEHEVLTFKGMINFYFHLQNILLKREIDIIHSYSFSTLKPLAMALNRQAQIPLVYTFNEKINLKNLNWIEKWLIGRTDLILTPTEILKDFACEIFPLNQRRINVTGAGVDLNSIEKKKEDNSRMNVSLFVPRHLVEMSSLQFFIECITTIKQYFEIEKNTQFPYFSLVTDIPWYEHALYDSIKRMILERHLEMDVSFQSRPLGINTFKDAKIFIGLARNEIFVDEDLYALAAGIPLLLPRTLSRHTLVNLGKYGESYHPDDVREFRTKFLTIFNSLEKYHDELSVIEKSLKETHHFETYLDQLYQHYERLYNQRLRITQKKRT